MTRLLGALLLIAMTYAPAMAGPVDWHCTAPTTGTTAVGYIWEASIDGGEFAEVARTTSTEVVIDQTPNVEYRLRVRAYDDEDHLGPWTPASLPYNYGAPGGCGMPFIRTDSREG